MSDIRTVIIINFVSVYSIYQVESDRYFLRNTGQGDLIRAAVNTRETRYKYRKISIAKGYEIRDLPRSSLATRIIERTSSID